MSTALVWLRNDLRLADNPALTAACRQNGRVIAVYVYETNESLRPIGAAARWWLEQSLRSFGVALSEIGVALRVETGSTEAILGRIVEETSADALHWNRRYGRAERDVDAGIKSHFRSTGMSVQSHPGNLLIEPWLIQTGQDKPYSVFTPFWKTLKGMEIARPIGAPEGVSITPPVAAEDAPPRWAQKIGQYWDIGEQAAQARLAEFFDESLSAYPDGRNFPAKTVTSKLSPHLRFGEISARQVWHAAQTFAHAHPDQSGAVDKFLSELAWRDFSYHQLYHRDDIAQVPMQDKFAGFGWRQAPAQVKAWQRAQTGYPIIDAGMRELWETGYMHNRVRMLVASFLTKNLRIDWREGERWFWDCLVDADAANNPASWQWVAGSGLDAAPYFRIFNPVTQGERFDANGDYVRRWVPELAGLPDRFIHQPFAAPSDVLKEAGVVLEQTYPKPIVDLKISRQLALEAFSALGATGPLT